MFSFTINEREEKRGSNRRRRGRNRQRGHEGRQREDEEEEDDDDDLEGEVEEGGGSRLSGDSVDEEDGHLASTSLLTATTTTTSSIGSEETQPLLQSDFGTRHGYDTNAMQPGRQSTKAASVAVPIGHRVGARERRPSPRPLPQPSRLDDQDVVGSEFVDDQDFALLELRFQEAAIFLMEGQENIKFDIHPTSPRQLRAFRRHHSTSLKVLDLIASILLLLLAVVEMPAIHNEPLGVLTPVYSGLAELACLLVLCVKPYFYTIWVGKAVLKRRERGWLRILLIVVGVCECLVVIARQKHHFRITRLLRPFFLIDSPYSTGVRRVLRQIGQSLVPVVDMVLLLLFFIFTSTIIAFYTFTGVQDDPYFATIKDSFVSLFVLITTANFPDVMMPAYYANMWSVVFFCVYIIVGLFFLQNLLLAVVYDTFRDMKLGKFRKLYMHRRQGIRYAYGLLKDDRYGGIPFTHFRGLMRYVDRHRSLFSTRLLFLSLNSSGSGAINLEEFYEFYSMKKLKWKKVPTPVREGVRARSSETGLQRVATALGRFFRSRRFEIIVDVVVVVNCIVVVADAVVISSSKQSFRQGTLFVVADYFFLVFYWVEVLAKAYGYGILEYWSNPWNKFDLIITVLSTVGLFLEGRLSAFVAIRQLRVVRLLTIKERFRFVLSAIFTLVASLGSYGLALLLVYYCFGVVGIELFAGKIYKGCCGDYYSGETRTQTYYLNNFDNIPRAFVTLFELMVVNNWFVIMDGAVTVTSEWARAYFILFYIIVVVISLNVVVAFILETFLSRMTFERTVKENEQMSRHIRKDVVLQPSEVIRFVGRKRQLAHIIDIAQSSNWLKFTGSRLMSMTDINLELFSSSVERWCQEDLVLRTSMLHNQASQANTHSPQPKRILSYSVAMHAPPSLRAPVKVQAMVHNINRRLPWALNSYQFHMQNSFGSGNAEQLSSSPPKTPTDPVSYDQDGDSNPHVSQGEEEHGPINGGSDVCIDGLDENGAKRMVMEKRDDARSECEGDDDADGGSGDDAIDGAVEQDGRERRLRRQRTRMPRRLSKMSRQPSIDEQLARASVDGWTATSRMQLARQTSRQLQPLSEAATAEEIITALMQCGAEEQMKVLSYLQSKHGQGRSMA